MAYFPHHTVNYIPHPTYFDIISTLEFLVFLFKRDNTVQITNDVQYIECIAFARFQPFSVVPQTRFTTFNCIKPQ